MKYLNAALTVIAVCLVLITFAVTGIIPAANAKNTNPHYVSVPVNPDGSINVKFVKGDVMDVNIDEVGGTSQSGSTLDVNIEDIRGGSVYGSVPVTIER
ncbi:MAG: hypothetical protein Q8R50_13390 [Sediminibacterium sp.]|nr:hypothetical protein [Sediminibacterium sp.]